ncbi:unnamed protein product [Clonostachys rosea f. rosea IK726]|uniref:Arrestin C-terminal-like domain-containing protein n=2 Tax=Bionectria ochroleuca TaxID=29856 RepID=A0A0B7JX74_BIOOC|nr:unnamed protein product [Clonostachys rosea f. rosea IK726]
MPSATPSGMNGRSVPSTLSSAGSNTPRPSTAQPSGANNNHASSAGNSSPSTPNSSSSSPRTDNQAALPTAKPASSKRFSSIPRFSSLSSRFSLPITLRGRKNHVADFHIQPQEPHKKYTAGENVRGSVILVIVKPIRITHLTVSLNGFARVLKEPALSASPHALLPSGGSENPRYHGHGFASIFQDEQVLSGDGRLEPGKYEFGFNLVFPERGLPSSIDFERGSISYLIMATLTRPTSMAATTSCDRKVTLVEKVDIGLLAPPRPKTIFLEPISKRVKTRKSFAPEKVVQATTQEVTNDLASEVGSVAPSTTAEDLNRDRGLDQSDIRSEISGESGRSASTGGLSRAELAQVATANQQVVDDKTITTTVELLRGGCLPGDTVPVRVTVQHIKRMKSMAGVIVTLFRQGRIDSAPPPELFSAELSKEDRKRADKNESYPKSRTGLGGLSMSSSGSKSIFRKDLDQNSAPLIIHPATLQTSVTVSVKIPDDSFPTIKGVPGNMIGFKYQVEVIVDLGGKLTNQLQGNRTSSRVGQSNGWFENGNAYGPRRGSSTIIDTSPLRREKGVVSMTIETIVGTVDTSRGRGKPRTQRQMSPSSGIAQSDEDEAYYTEHSQPDENHWVSPSPFVGSYPQNTNFAPQAGNQPYYGAPPPTLPHQPHGPTAPSQPYPYSVNGETNGVGHVPAPDYIPSPQVPDERNMSEKERIQLAENRLLPSQPPAAGPSSPPDNEEENIYDADETPRLPHVTPSFPNRDPEDGPSAPTEGDLQPLSPSDPSQDKQEIERERLLAEASAPQIPEDMQRPDSTSRRDMAPDAEPSAPMITEEDEYRGYGVGAGPSRARDHRLHNEQLPAYER